jgi:hypothetical protein
MRSATTCLLVASFLVSGQARGATRREVTAAVVRAADRLAAIRSLGLTWEDAPYLVGLLLVARERERLEPGSGQPWVDRVARVVGDGARPIAHGDYAGYAQAALDLYRITPTTDTSRRTKLLSATQGPFDFALRALRITPANGPPAAPWWLESGYGTRFWVDDLFTLPPAFAMRGSRLDSLPGDGEARDLAYEWIESYLYDHRPPATTDAESPDVPSRRRRAGPLLWDPGLSLFRHDTGPGRESYWGRGNGWAAWGLARSARYLDAPYEGGRYEEVVDRTAIREVLTRLAGALAARRREDGGWPTDLLQPDACAASETSATGLFAYMLAKGVNEGWLDRATFTPIALKSFAFLLGRIDAAGDLSGIQPPGTGPDCGTTASNDADVDVSYGVGALLLAASEVLQLPEEDLAAMEEAAARPADPRPPVRSWIVALPSTCDSPELVLSNAGTAPVQAWLSGSSTPATVPPGASVVLAFAPLDATPDASVVALRSDGDLTVRPRAVCASAAGGPDSADGRVRVRRRGAGIAAPLWTVLAPQEETVLHQERDGFLVVGGLDVSPAAGALIVTIAAPDGTSPTSVTLPLSQGHAAFRILFVAAGSRVDLSNASGSAALVPLAFDAPAR